jgi:hypothetical protein
VLHGKDEDAHVDLISKPLGNGSSIPHTEYEEYGLGDTSIATLPISPEFCPSSVSSIATTDADSLDSNSLSLLARALDTLDIAKLA